MKLKRTLCLFLTLLMLLSGLDAASAAGNTEYVYDKADVLTNAEEQYFEARIAALTDAYDLDIVLLTVSGRQESSLKKEAESFYQKQSFGDGVLLLCDIKNNDYWIYASGEGGSVFTGKVISSLRENSYFPWYLDEKKFDDAFDDYLDRAEKLLADNAERMECIVSDACITAASQGNALITVSLSLTNYSDENIAISDALKAFASIGDKKYEGKVSFRYKAVYSLEELQGSVSFEIPAKDIGSAQLTISCLHKTQKLATGSIRDERTDKQKKASAATAEPAKATGLDKNGSYSSKEEVAAYLRQYGRLPSNYITKNEAQKLGWNSAEGNLWAVAPGKSIGGDRFGNYEGLLPGGAYTECDIGYQGGYRDSRRLVFRKDGSTWHIYYTEDHYETFEEVK